MKILLKTFVLTTLTFISVGFGKVSAHPWGGLVIDNDGNIYFTFISPFVDDDHYACVWELNSQQKISKALESKYSPSDIILSRTPGRIIHAAERNSTGSGFQAQLWRMDGKNKELLVEPTANETMFYIQAYAVTDEGIIFFARDDKLYQKNKDGAVNLVKTNRAFSRIEDLAWGPNGKLYIVDRGSIKILENNGNISTLATGLKEENPEELPFSGANILFDFAIDKKGNVYIAYYGNRRVLKVTEKGEVSDFLRSGPWSPHGIDIYKGDVYVLESTIGSGSWWKFWEKDITIPRIRKVDANGKVSTIFEYQPEK